MHVLLFYNAKLLPSPAQDHVEVSVIPRQQKDIGRDTGTGKDELAAREAVNGYCRFATSIVIAAYKWHMELFIV